MRFLITLLVGAVLGIGTGLVADRTLITRQLIDTHLGPILGTTPKVDASDGVPGAQLLAQYNVRPCFSGSPLADEDRPWLERFTVSDRFDQSQGLRPSPDLADFPGLVKIESIESSGGADREHCAAARISKHWFLTAAHCVVDNGFETATPVYDMVVVTPSDDVNRTGSKNIPITGAVCHGAYKMDRLQYVNDVALFHVSDVSELSNVGIAQLEHDILNLQPSDFGTTYIAGWGMNGKQRYLQGGPVRMSQVGEAVLISNRINGFGPDVGDSGAPLYVATQTGPIVAGVLSQVTSEAGADNKRGVYVRVKSVADWITTARALCGEDGRFVCGS